LLAACQALCEFDGVSRGADRKRPCFIIWPGNAVRANSLRIAHKSAGLITMAWFWRTALEINEDILRTEERLTKIAQLQVDLSQHNQQIKDLTSTIIRTLDADVNAVTLAKITPMLAAIPPLLQEVVPAIKTIEVEFETLYEGQRQIKADISRVVSMIADLATQLRNAV
jgi:hypothetical protein